MRCTEFPPYNDFYSSLQRVSDPTHVAEFFDVVSDKLNSGVWSTLRDIEIYYGFTENSLSQHYELLEEKLAEITGDGFDFLSKKLHTSPRKYEISKFDFDSKYVNMMEYLEQYNLDDCRLLSQSIDKYSAGFLQDWKVNVHSSMSLPGVAEKIAYTFYNSKAVPIYSFAQKFRDYNIQIRNQLHGGMCMVFHRYIELNPTERVHPKCVYEAKNGQPYKRLVFYDFNSLVSQ